MFGLVRVLLGCALLGISHYIIAKNRLSFRKKHKVTFVILVAVLVSASAFVPLENGFITFKSPESAFEYYSLGANDSMIVVEGTNCDLVVASRKNTNTHLIIPKTTEGWKVGLGLNTRKVYQKIVDGCVIYVYQYKDIHDYFVAISCTTEQLPAIADSYGSSFQSLTDESNLSSVGFVTYYTHIPEFNKDYCIYIDNYQVFVK